jgi:hypothetical protein
MPKVNAASIAFVSILFPPCGLDTSPLRTDRRESGNSWFNQWLIEHLCFVSSVVVADNFVLRNRQLLLAAKRYVLFQQTATN